MQAEQIKVSLKPINDLKVAPDEHVIVAIPCPHGKTTFVNDRFCKISKHIREGLPL